MAEIEKPATKKSGFKYKFYLAVKRVFDVVASALFILLFSWLYIIIALAVKISDGGKVFYKHRRLGKNGKIIYLIKFRSMMEGADNLYATLNPDERKKYEKEYKVDNDARITGLGRFLRNTSLDELPNFFSVIKGDISIVGPRPVMELEAKRKYGEDKVKLLSVRPGMIGLWAVKISSIIFGFASNFITTLPP